MKFKKGDKDKRWNSDRLKCTETVCDNCTEVILESELRWEDAEGDVICDSCRDKEAGGEFPIAEDKGQALPKTVRAIVLGGFVQLIDAGGSGRDVEGFVVNDDFQKKIVAFLNDNGMELVNRDMFTWSEGLIHGIEVDCGACGWDGKGEELLEIKIPGDTVLACPQCKDSTEIGRM